MYDCCEKKKMPKKTRKRKNKTKLSHLPQFNVILHDDDQNKGNDVVDKIMQVIPKFRGENGELMAIKCVKEAHTEGRSFLVTVHKERAELYIVQFSANSPPIEVTAEPCK